MDNKDLSAQVERLFSAIPESEEEEKENESLLEEVVLGLLETQAEPRAMEMPPSLPAEPEAKGKKDGSLLEEVVAGLLESEPAAGPVAAEPTAVEVSPPVPAEPGEWDIQRMHTREQRPGVLFSRSLMSFYERTRPGVTPISDNVLFEDFGELNRAVEQAMLQREVVVQSDASDGEGRAVLVAPITLRGEVIGVLGLHETEDERQWTTDEIALIKAVAEQMALAIENARLLEETRRRLREQAMLFDASQSLVGAPLRVEEIAEVTIRQLAGMMRNAECSFSLLDPQKGILQAIADFWVEEGSIRREELVESFSLSDYPATAHVMETQQPLVIQANNPNADPAELAYMQERGAATLVIIPLVVKGQAIGVMELEMWEERHYTSEELNLATTLANQAAVAMENARLLEETQQRAERDRLIADITARVRASIDPETILKTAARELGAALGVDRTFIQLGANTQRSEE